jgi:hypothetical protein
MVSGPGGVLTVTSVRSSCLVASATLLAAVMLAGCGNSNFDASGAWFSKPANFFGGNNGYTYSNLTDSTKLERPITANDMIDANGGCPASAMAAPPPPQQQVATANPDGNTALSADVANLIGGGIAIGMSECEVVGRLGRPTGINFAKNPNGYRSLVLTYNGGPRPGVYRFGAGRLTEMDRVEGPPPPPETAKKKIAKKKPAKPKDPSTGDDKS